MANALKIKILGDTGFIGSNILEQFKSKYIIVDDNCDVLINCAGFSKLYEGNNDIEKMKSVEESVINKIATLKFNKLIHISTSYIDLFPFYIYCQIKRCVEDTLLLRYKTKVLRLGNVIGHKMIKGIVFDLLNDMPLFISSDSLHNLITTTELANIISHIIEIENSIVINIGASDSILTSDIAKILNKNPNYGRKKINVVFNTDQLQSQKSPEKRGDRA